MNNHRFAARILLILVCLLLAGSAAFAGETDVTGEWLYRVIVTGESKTAVQADGEQEAGVLLSDLETMPLNLLDKVFGKLDYSVSFSADHRFALHITVLGMRFDAQGAWSVRDGRMTLVYNKITGFEALWWLGGFDHLTHCDAQHTMTETVAYEATDDTLTFLSGGAKLVFARP